MAWSGSGFSTEALADLIDDTLAFAWGSVTWNVGLWPSTITPDFTASAATFAYDAGVWTAASELDDPANWPTGGPALVTSAPEAEQPAAGQLRLDATDVSQASTTIAAARGCMIYKGSLGGDNGLLAVDFGSDFSTTNGTFAITWDTNGVAYFDVW